MENFVFTSALCRDHILRNFRPGEGTVASPALGCRARNSGQLLISARKNDTFVRPSSVQATGAAFLFNYVG